MNRKKEHIKELLRKYRNHIATPEEFEELFDYLQNPENMEILKDEVSDQWNENLHPKPQSPVEWRDLQREVLKQKALERKKKTDRQHVRSLAAVAASLLIIVGFGLGIFYKGFNSSEVIFQTGFGQVESIVLDDGSRVTLNANSTLVWDKNWQRDGIRKARLSGEAFFDVESFYMEDETKMGFEIETKDMTIDVVGTSFNVKSRGEKTAVFLEEGMVHLDLKEKESDVKESKQDKIVLQPGESLTYSNETKLLERVLGDKLIDASWMTGTFVFENQSVREILKSLEDIYGKSFVIKDQKLLNKQLTAGLPYSDWPIVKSALELLLDSRLIEDQNDIYIE